MFFEQQEAFELVEAVISRIAKLMWCHTDQAHSAFGSGELWSKRVVKKRNYQAYLRASGSGRQPQRRMARLQMSGSSQRRDPSAALLSSSDRSRLAALNVMLTPCPVP